MASKMFTAVVHKEDDLYVAECPEIGTVSQDLSIEEAISNLKEATELYLDEFPQKTNAIKPFIFPSHKFSLELHFLTKDRNKLLFGNKSSISDNCLNIFFF